MLLHPTWVPTQRLRTVQPPNKCITGQVQDTRGRSPTIEKGSLGGDLKSRSPTLVWNRHWYVPSSCKPTSLMLKVTELKAVARVRFPLDPEMCCRTKVPLRWRVDMEQVILTPMPRSTSLAGLMEKVSFVTLSAKQGQQHNDWSRSPPGGASCQMSLNRRFIIFYF